MKDNLITVFQGDDIVKFIDSVTYLYTRDPSRPEDFLQPGEYMVVHCEIDFMGNQKAITDMVIRRVRFEFPLYHGNVIKLPEMTPGNVIVMELTTTDLSPVQCEKVISGIKSQGTWLWDYAAPKVKKALQPVLSKEDEAFSLASQGADLISKKQFQEATTQLQQAVELHPKISGVRVNLGKTSLEVGQVEDAIKWFEEELSLAADPQVLNANLYLAAIYDAKGDTARTQIHLAAVTATAEYRRNPISMDPAVVRKIKMIVANQAQVRSTTVVPLAQEKLASKKNWWQFWK